MKQLPFLRRPLASAGVCLAAAAFTSIGLAASVGAETVIPPAAIPGAVQDEAIRIDALAVTRAVEAAGASGPAQEALVIAESDVRRALVYTLGSTELESRKVDVYIDEEIRRQIAEGAEGSAFDVSDEEVATAVEDTLRQIKEQYPTMDENAVLRHNNIDPSSLGRMTAQSKLFERVFLPDDPAEWPATTREAIKNSAGDEFLQRLEESHAQRQELLASGDEAAAAQQEAGQAMFRMLMRQMVMQALNSTSEIKTASDGLPEGVAMRVNGVDIMTEDVYAAVADRVTERDRQLAEQWVTKCALLERVLKASGSYLTDEEFTAEFDAYEEPYKGSPLNLEVIVRSFKRFPSMEGFRRYFRLMKSYERMIGEELTDETLNGHLPRANRLMGVGSIDVEFLLCSAFDFANKSWLEDGWSQAASEAREVAQALADSGGENWDALLDQHSDFWDPPLSTTPQQQAPKRKNKGRFGVLNRNELLQYLEESDYTGFLEGWSVGDEVFFSLEPGELGGPWVGPYGYYFARVKRRVPPSKIQSLGDPTFRDMVVQDYVAVRFNEFGRDVYEAATTEDQ